MRLRMVEVSGRKVENVFARISDRQRPDLLVGVTLFPRSSIEFSKDGLTRISKRRCATGSLILPGRSNVVVVGPDNINRRTLLDISYSGPPEIRETRPAVSPGARVCETSPRVLRFGNFDYGTDVFCSSDPKPFSALSYDVHLGPRSMTAKLGIIDLQDSLFCVVS